MGAEEIRFLDWGVHPLLATEEKLLELVDQIREMRPDIVLTHWTPDRCYPDHSIAGELVVHACGQVGAVGLKMAHPPIPRPQIFFFETTYPLPEFNLFNPDTYIDITDVFEQKIKALQELAVTQAPLIDYYTECAIKRGRQARSFMRGKKEIVYAEAFVRRYPWVGSFFP